MSCSQLFVLGLLEGAMRRMHGRIVTGLHMMRLVVHFLANHVYTILAQQIYTCTFRELLYHHCPAR